VVGWTGSGRSWSFVESMRKASMALLSNKISESVAHIKELARSFRSDRNRRGRRKTRIFRGTCRERRSGNFVERAGIAIDLEHGDLAGSGIEDKEETPQGVDGHAAAFEFVERG